MTSSRLVAKNTLAQIASKGVTSLIGLVTRKLLTTYLGPAGFGDYVFILTYSSLFGSIADWGTLVIAVREASRRSDIESKVFGSAIMGRLLLSVIAGFAALVFLPFFNLSSSISSLIAISSVLIVAFALKASLGIIFESKMNMSLWVWVEVSASLTTLLLFALAVRLQMPTSMFLISLLVATTISIIVGFSLARRIARIDFYPDWKLIIHLIREALPMGGILIMFSIYNRLDTVILKLFRSSSEVGFYGLAYFIYENVVIVAAYLINSVFPLLSRESVGNVPSLNFGKYYQKIWDIMMVLALGAVAVTFLAAPVLVKLISSSEFLSSVYLLRVLSFSLFFSFLNHVTGFSLIALGRQKQYLVISLTALVFNVVLNLYFVPRVGSIASAWITVGTEALVHLLTFTLISRVMGRRISLRSFPRTAVEFLSTRGKIF